VAGNDSTRGAQSSAALAKDATIYLAGHTGMVGAALVRRLTKHGYSNLITRTRAQLDLCDGARVREFFAGAAVDYVVLAAARVGGIRANDTYPADFIRDNLMIAANVIHEACVGQRQRPPRLPSCR